MRCDIIIPIWNQLEFTRVCMDNLIKNTHYPYRLILIDNSSDLSTKRYLESLKDNKKFEVELIRNEENLGFIKAVNQGLKLSSAPYVCMMNNDTIPAPGWLERMVDFAEAHADVGLVNPQCDGHLDTPIEVHARRLGDHKGEYMEMNQCQGFCMLVKRDLINKIGYLDESFGIGGFDDTDYSMRAHLAGYRCVSIKDAYVYHRLHGSFAKAGNRKEWVERNQKIYYKKWGKHLRVEIVLSLDHLHPEDILKLILLSYGFAREWSWVRLWINYKGDKKDIERLIGETLRNNNMPSHQNISINILNLSKFIFNLSISCKFLERLRKRMKDKRFDVLVAFDNEIIKFISPFAKLLGTRIIKLFFNDKISDWHRKGKELAILIRKERENEFSKL